MSTSLLIHQCLALVVSALAPPVTIPGPPRALIQQPPEVAVEPVESPLLDSLLPVADGIVWYGSWEDAMAEMKRTGKPVLLHMGSPRERDTCVPGTW